MGIRDSIKKAAAGVLADEGSSPEHGDGGMYHLPPLGWKREDDIAAEADIALAAGDAGWSTTRTLADAVINTQGDYERAEANGATEAELERFARRVERARIAQARGSAGGRGEAARLRGVIELRSAVAKWLSGNRFRQPVYRDCIVELPTGADPRLIAEEVGGLKARRQEVEAALEPKEVVMERLTDEIRKLAEAGRPRVNIESTAPYSHRVTPKLVASIRWPLDHLEGVESTSPNASPAVTDAAALVAWAMRDKIITSISDSVDHVYMELGGMPTFTAGERRAELKRIDAEVLKLERVEAAIIWAAYDAGEPLALRGDIHPLAALQIEVASKGK